MGKCSPRSAWQRARTMRPGALPRFEEDAGLVGLMKEGRAREAEPASPPSDSSWTSSLRARGRASGRPRGGARGDWERLLARRSNEELEKEQRDLHATGSGLWPGRAGGGRGGGSELPDEAHEELLLRLTGERDEAAGGSLGALGRGHQEELERAALQRVEQLGLLLRVGRAALAECGDDSDERLAERGVQRGVADGAIALARLARRRRRRHALAVPRAECRDDAARLVHDDRCE